MTRPGLEPAPPASEANALTITLSGPVYAIGTVTLSGPITLPSLHKVVCLFSDLLSMMRGQTPTHCENTQVPRETTEDDDDDDRQNIHG